ncbi:hypothetical protein EGW08_009598 [Elysia chlorotica]|uniref:Arrestin C-terminal-like domain-containing protein n=1 Tax=Elysia chlorotica TaxID=188477 RepID=A0A3S1BF85_ELYCH|nr:hypothetical protein EGW08_009598 [Elysia chlorotica]
MKLSDFEIRFDNPRGVFATGDNVSGVVFIKLAKPMKMRCLQLYFEGRAKSHWEVKRGRSKTDYKATENYINETINLFGTGSTTSEHPAGLHSYPFSLNLSQNLPSSFEGRRGYVRYFCKATINRPWKFDEHTKRAFTVIHHLDLNFEPTSGMPVWGEQEQTIDGCCCTSGTVQARMTVNKTGFVPGEPMAFTVDIKNNSDSEISGLELELRQVVRYTGYSDSVFSSGQPKFHTKTDSYPLFTGQFSVKRRSEGHLSRSVCVPALPPSRLDGCGIIEISYFVFMAPQLRWSQIKVEREVIIGSIPLQDMSTAPPAFSDVVNEQTDFISTCPSAPPNELAPPPYQEPPPSYEESVFGRVEIRDENDDVHTEGNMSWAPSYPYYHWDPNTRHFQMIATTQDPPAPTVTPSGDAPATSVENLQCPPYNQL